MQTVEYSKAYRLHAVKLYREYNSSLKVRARLEKETRAGKWTYDTLPTYATIMKWVRKYDPDFDSEEVELDPIKRADIEMLGLIRGIQINARRAIRNVKFRNMIEVVAALKFCNTTRQELAERYKADKSMPKQAEKVAKKLRLNKKANKELKREIVNESIKAIDFLAEKEKRGLA